MTIPTLQTARLSLRPWSPSDGDRLFTILQEEDILHYFPRTTPPTRDKVDKYIAHHLTHWQERGYGHWAVIYKQTNQIIGWCGLEFLPETDETEVAYLLSRDFWGRGLATEAARSAVEFGFQVASLERIIGLAHPGNIASQRVLEKCGLQFVDRKDYFGIELFRYWIDKPPSQVG
ncbi:MAG: GNAT family N-acetyltransferase [Chloroflexota bacterium]